MRAALEAVCFQTRDILEAMNRDCGIPLTKLLVDGGMTVNNYAMQMQADLCGIPVGESSTYVSWVIILNKHFLNVSLCKYNIESK